MNTSGTNAPSTVISGLLAVAALVIALVFRASGNLLAYTLPGILLLAAILTRLSLLMANQWERAVILRFGKLHAIRGPGLFVIVPFIDTGIEDRLFELVQLGDVGLGVAPERRIRFVLFRPGPGDQNELAGQLALPVGQIPFTLHGCNDDRGGEDALGRRGPGHRDALQLHGSRRDHADVRGLDPPATAEIERIGPDVLQSPAAKFSRCPVLGPAHRRRVGHPTANLIRQVFGGLRDLAVIEALVSDAVENATLCRPRRPLGRVRAGRQGGKARGAEGKSEQELVGSCAHPGIPSVLNCREGPNL